jgi:hypothetical protein
MYENGKMRPAETVLRSRAGVIKGNDGGDEFDKDRL